MLRAASFRDTGRGPTEQLVPTLATAGRNAHPLGYCLPAPAGGARAAGKQERARVPLNLTAAMIEIATTVEEVRTRIAAARAGGETIGFAPTMGALHDGHLALIHAARAECGFVAVSVFVNPTQFPPGSDLARYPRDLPGDAEKAASAGAQFIFAPPVEEVYPPGDATVVEVTGQLVDCLCGPHRPGHFRGVATVCARLFNIVSPDRAYFGQKDYQQLLVIRRMVRDLRLPLQVVAVPTVREPDGLAMSSRNLYLSPEQRRAAAVLSRGLMAARDRFFGGERSAAALAAAAAAVIAAEPSVELQYLELRDADTLEEVQVVDRCVVLALAAQLGPARLIDNILLKPEQPTADQG